MYRPLIFHAAGLGVGMIARTPNVVRSMRCSRLSFGCILIALTASLPSHAQHATTLDGEPPGPPVETSERFGDLEIVRYTIADGLPENNIMALAQDTFGFLWFGTSSGLVRFDGRTFKVFTHDPNDPGSLSYRWAESVFIDSEGDLWVGTHGGGLNRYDPHSESFSHFKHDPDDETSINGDIVTSIVEDREGYLWVGTHCGLSRLDRESGSFMRFNHDPADPRSLSNDQVRVLLVDRGGQLWVGTGSPFSNQTPLGEGGLNRYDPATGSFTRFLHDPGDPETLFESKVHSLYEDANGTLWVGTKGNVLHRMNRAEGTFERLSLDQSTREAMVPEPRKTLSPECDPFVCGVTTFIDGDDDGTLWVGALGKGVIRYAPDTGSARLDSLRLNEMNDVSPRLAWTLRTRDGTRWIGGMTPEGLFRVATVSNHFPHYVLREGENGLSNDGVNDIEVDARGFVWIATTAGGLNRFDPATGTFRHYRHDPQNTNSLSSDRLRSLFVDDAGSIWVGTADAGLNRLDPSTGDVTRYGHDPSDPSSLSDPRVQAITGGADGALWVGTWGGGLNRLNPATGTFTHYRHVEGDPASLGDDRIQSLYQDSDGSLLVGTFLRLDRFDREMRLYARQYESWGQYSFLEDNNGALWIVDDDTGLNLIDRSSGGSVRYLPQEWLGARWALAAIEDDSAYIWVSASRGGELGSGSLARFDPKTGRFRTIGKSDGVPPIFFWHDVVAKDLNGTLYFGGYPGFIAVDPAKVQQLALPDVVLTGIRLFNERIAPSADAPLREPLHRAQQVVFKHDQHDFTIEYAAIDFRSQSPLQYQFMLENHDLDWVEADGQTAARYSRVSPGKYSFRVRTARQGDEWIGKEAYLSVVVLPPWWRNAFAYAAYALLLLAAIAGGAQIQRRRLMTRARILRARELETLNQELAAHKRQLENQNAQLEEQARRLAYMDEVKSRFFANISHEFRTPLTLILGPLREALSSAQQPLARTQLRMMYRNAQRLLKLISQLLDLSKLEAGGMRLHRRNQDIVAFLRRHVLAFASQAEREGIALSFVSDADVLQATFDAEKLEKVVSNLLSNAFKFTSSGGRIRVSVRQEEGAISIVVRDSGEGIPAEELPLIFDRFHQVDSSTTRRYEGSGIGLSLAKELVELHGGSIEVESERSFGCTFTVRLPLGAESAIDERAIHEPAESHDLGEAIDPLPYPSPIDEIVEAIPTRDEPRPEPVDAAGTDDRHCILVVEDNVDMRIYLRSHLSSDYRLFEASDGEEGLRLAREYQPDLVISDVMMPSLDGFELCRALKSDPQLGHIPIIMLTARADETSRIDGLEAGADDYLSKPFSLEELSARVENLVEIRRRLRERFSDEVRLGPEGIVVPSADAAFVERVRGTIEARMSDSQFGVDQLADVLGVSERQLYRRVKETSGLTPGAYIRMMRLERATQLLKQKSRRVSEVAYAVGFNSPKHFGRLYRQVFGHAPSESADAKQE